jgi:DNA polymerase delta subunit 2
LLVSSPNSRQAVAGPEPRIETGNPVLVPRVLEVVKSQLCYIVGTVYMDMPLKPNVLEDIARDVRSCLLHSRYPRVETDAEKQKSIPPPPPLERFCSDADSVMLEDESGRIRLVGAPLENARLVTGVIIGALGVETANGDFEVIDICYAGDVTRASPHGMKLSEESMDVDGTVFYYLALT